MVEQRKATAKLNWLFSHPKKQRMPNLLIVGPTNNGKSMIIEKFVRTMGGICQEERRRELESIPVVCMQMPSNPSLVRFYSMLVQMIGIPSRGGIVALEQQALEVLSKNAN